MKYKFCLDRGAERRYPVAKRAYMINVASDRNGVGYGKWIHIDGFSERVIRWIYDYEQAGRDGTLASSPDKNP